MPTESWAFNVYSLPAIAGLVLFWLFGLYIVTRSPRSLISLVAASALFATAIYLAGDALLANAQRIEDWLDWAGRTWIGTAAAPALWYWLTVLLLRSRPGRPTGRYLRLIAYPLGAVFAIATLVFAVLARLNTSLLIWYPPVQSQTPSPAVPLYVALPGAHYGCFTGYALAACATALGHAAWLYRSTTSDRPLAARYRWFVYAAIALLISTGYLLIDVWLRLDLPMWPGYVGLTIGLGLMAWNVARYNALIAGQVIQADLLNFIFTMLGASLLYGFAVILLFPPFRFETLVAAIALALLASTTHALGDRFRWVFDRLFFRESVQGLRSGLRQIAEEAAVAPALESVIEDARQAIDRVQEIEVRREVEDALRRLNDVAALAKHPLLRRLTPDRAGVIDPVDVQPASLEHGRALRQRLVDVIDLLKPGGDPPLVLSGGWLQYVVVYEAYVQGRPNKQIMRSHEISEGSFHRARRQAIAGIAQDLVFRDAQPGALSPSQTS